MTTCSKGPGAPTTIKDPKSDQELKVKQSLAKIKNILMVMSGKGGVGKTSVAVNLAITLAAEGCRVGLLDVDIHGPDIPRMLGLGGLLDVTANQKLAPLAYSANLAAVSIESLIVNKDEAIIWRGPLKYAAIQQFIGDVDWGPLDYLIIDAPPGTGDEPLTVAQMIPDARAVIVSTPQELALADVRKSISFCKTLKMGIAGLIENMSGFVCPHCGKNVDLFGSGGGRWTALAADIPFLGTIPFDSRMVACGDSGTSFLEKYPDSPITRAFQEVAAKITAGTRANQAVG